MSNKYTALVLQGGGALGAYEHGVVQALYAQQGFVPDVITGVSIGAISASILTGAKAGPVEGLNQLWERLIFPDLPLIPDQIQWLFSLPYNRGMYKPNMSAYIAPFTSTNWSDTSPLYETFEALIDKDKLNSPDSPQLVVTAVNVETGQLREFDNRKEALSFEHIAASGSLPPYFPMTQIDGQHYWDGGLFSNTPLRAAINGLECLGDDTSEREIILVELFPQQGELPRNMKEVEDRVTEIKYQNKITFDDQLAHKIGGFIDMVQQIDRELPPDSPVRELEAFQKLKKHKKINKITKFTFAEDHSKTGATDFTRSAIERRRLEGFNTARRILGLM